MQYETNQSTKLVIKTNYQTPIGIPHNSDILLEIENYVGFMDFGIIKSIDIEGTTYQIMYTTLKFVENKPILTLFVRLPLPYINCL